MPAANFVLRSLLLALVALSMLAMTTATTLRAQVVPMTEFREALSPHGRWVQHPRHGAAWKPEVGPDWRPYTRGRWLASDEGWYWHSEEPWAWATYHYGRWTADPRQGWLWVPGDRWAPAWVAWRMASDDGPARRVGWAPLAPDGGAPSDETAWSFVALRALTVPLLELRLIPLERNRALLRRTEPAPRGPDARLVEAHSRRPMPYVRLVESASREPRGSSRAAIQRGVVEVYRPKVTSRTDLGPIPPPQPRPPDVPQKTMTDRYLEKGGKGPIVPHRTPAPTSERSPAPPPSADDQRAPSRTPEPHGTQQDPPLQKQTTAPVPRSLPVRPKTAAEPKAATPPPPASAPSSTPPPTAKGKEAAAPAPTTPKIAQPKAPPAAAKAEPKAPPPAPAPQTGAPVVPIIVNPGAANR